MAGHNIWAFLIKQKKYKTSPLVVFYVIVVLLSSLRIIQAITELKFTLDRTLFTVTLMPILKVNLGLVQCWMVIELTLRVKLTTFL